MLAAFAALLDRSFAQMAEASDDGRRFDRGTLASVSDVWDNNTFSFVQAASDRGRRRRERRARAGLISMSVAGPSRRSWMVTQAALAGHDLEDVLPPAKPSGPYRNYRGQVMPVAEDLAAQSAEELSRAYDLSTAEVLDVRFEWASDVLVGGLELSVARLYLSGDAVGQGRATLQFGLREVDEVRYDSADARGVKVSAGSHGVTLDFGVGGRVRAQTAYVHVEDVDWHLSPAGRRADAATAARSDTSRRTSGTNAGPLSDCSGAAARLLLQGMLEIRMVRYRRHSADVGIADILRTFSGAADAILAAGAHRRAGRRRAAYRGLAETWIRRAGPELLSSFASALAHTGPACLLDVIRESERELRGSPGEAEGGDQPAPVSAGSLEIVSAAPTPVALRLFSYSAPRQLYDQARQGRAYIVLAEPQGAAAGSDVPWRLRAVEFAAPGRCRVRTEAFQGDHDAPTTLESGDGQEFVLGDGALAITSDDPRGTA